MAVTQYIGARYVPLFAEPSEWNSNNAYEPLTIVSYQGASYTSKQAVPVGIDITNEAYWALTGNYNAQVEQYRREVRAFDTRIKTAQETADNAVSETQTLNTALNTEKNARIAADTDIRNDFAQDLADEVAGLNTTINTEVNRLEAEDENLDGRITAEANARQSADTALGTRLTNEIASLNTSIETATNTQLIILGDSWMVGSRSTASALRQRIGIKTAKTFNFAESGTGFLRDHGTKFQSQLDNAIADARIDKNAPTIIVVVGGVNDLRSGFNTSKAYITEINSMYSKALQKFKSLKFTVFFMQFYKGSTYPANLIKEVIAGATCQVVNLFPMFRTQLYEDELHLNTEGQRICGGYLADCLGNGKLPQYSGYTQTITELVKNSLNTTKIENAYLREVWDDYSTTVYLHIITTEIVPADEFNGWVSGVEFSSPIMPITPNYMRGTLNTLAVDEKINASAYKAPNEQYGWIGMRNPKQLPVYAYNGVLNFVW